jgi:site-specific recombinase XerD
MNAPSSWKITRRASGQWVLNLVYPGGRRRQLSCDSKKHAEQRLAEALKAIEAPPALTNGFTLGDALPFLEEHYAGMVSERTSLDYTRQVVEFLGHQTPVQEVEIKDTQRMIAHFIRRGNQAQTINAKLSKLRQIRRMAKIHGGVKSLPPISENLPVHNLQKRVWSDEEMRLACHDLLMRGKHQEAAMVVFLGEMGCRFSEAARLKGQDVDLEKRTVRFFKAVKDNKEGNRVLRLTPRALEAIQPYLPPMPHMRVWTLKYKQLDYQVDKALARCGIDMPRAMHALRHTVGSALGNAGRTTLEICAWLGHRNAKTCERYVHMKSEELDRCFEVLEKRQG